MKHSLFNVALLALVIVTAGRVYQSQHASLSTGYRDLPRDHAYAKAVQSLTTFGIVQGYDDGTFRPEKTMNRAEFTKIVVGATIDMRNVEGCLERYQMTVRDVERGTWFAPYVCSAMLYGYVGGYPDGSFRPERNISFVEAAKIIAIAFGKETEAAEVWYQPYVMFLEQRSAIPVTIMGFSAHITRGEMAEMVYRLKTNTVDRPSLSYSALEHAAAPPIAEEAEELLSLINAERIYKKIEPLRYNFQLEAAAAYHAEHMDRANFYEHQSPDGDTVLDRIRATGYLDVDLATCNCKKWTYRYGENIMRTDSAEQAMAYWMNSPIHTENIFSTEYVEAGVARRGRYWVVVFGGKFFEV